MNLKKHIITNIITFSVWFIFLLGGLPSDYYYLWPLKYQVIICVIAFLLILPITYLTLIKVWQKDFLKNSFWIAFYGSVPLAIYDYIYVGILKGFGCRFIFTHWYLSIFYLIVWIEMPVVGYLLNKKERAGK